ncbi:MAG: phosphotransferase enzyme family protein [Desulfobulbaceae bacterium]
MTPELRAALFFVEEGDIANIAPFGAGNVNDTFLLTLDSGEERILQRVNPAVFAEPLLVMRNLRLVSAHLQAAGARPDAVGHPFQPVVLYGGRAGDTYLAEDGAAWRLLNRISGGHTRQAITTVPQARELGRGLGLFHRLLSTLDPALLADPLPEFHVTPRYLAHYDQVCARAGDMRRPVNSFCRLFIEERRATAGMLEDLRGLGAGIIHGDPKVANFLFDEEGELVISLIDLDTVKPGLLLHDLGDALRSCCNGAGETPAAPELVRFDPALFAGWLEGYCAEALSLLTDEDLNRLVDAVGLIAFELGLRFYTDYLEGDRYFKVAAAGQNLQRALTQFQLSRSIEQQRDGLTAIAARLAAEKNNQQP